MIIRTVHIDGRFPIDIDLYERWAASLPQHAFPSYEYACKNWLTFSGTFIEVVSYVADNTETNEIGIVFIGVGYQNYSLNNYGAFNLPISASTDLTLSILKSVKESFIAYIPSDIYRGYNAPDSDNYTITLADYKDFDDYFSKRSKKVRNEFRSILKNESKFRIEHHLGDPMTLPNLASLIQERLYQIYDQGENLDFILQLVKASNHITSIYCEDQLIGYNLGYLNNSRYVDNILLVPKTYYQEYSLGYLIILLLLKDFWGTLKEYLLCNGGYYKKKFIESKYHWSQVYVNPVNGAYTPFVSNGVLYESGTTCTDSMIKPYMVETTIDHILGSLNRFNTDDRSSLYDLMTKFFVEHIPCKVYALVYGSILYSFAIISNVGSTYHLTYLHTMEVERGHGYAKMLLSFILAKYKNLSLFVNEDNVCALRLYSQFTKQIMDAPYYYEGDNSPHGKLLLLENTNDRTT